MRGIFLSVLVGTALTLGCDTSSSSSKSTPPSQPENPDDNGGQVPEPVVPALTNADLIDPARDRIIFVAENTISAAPAAGDALTGVARLDQHCSNAGLDLVTELSGIDATILSEEDQVALASYKSAAEGPFMAVVSTGGDENGRSPESIDSRLTGGVLKTNYKAVSMVETNGDEAEGSLDTVFVSDEEGTAVEKFTASLFESNIKPTTEGIYLHNSNGAPLVAPSDTNTYTFDHQIHWGSMLLTSEPDDDFAGISWLAQGDDLGSDRALKDGSATFQSINCNGWRTQADTLDAYQNRATYIRLRDYASLAPKMTIDGPEVSAFAGGCNAKKKVMCVSSRGRVQVPDTRVVFGIEVTAEDLADETEVKTADQRCTAAAQEAPYSSISYDAEWMAISADTQLADLGNYSGSFVNADSAPVSEATSAEDFLADFASVEAAIFPTEAEENVAERLICVSKLHSDYIKKTDEGDEG